MQITSGFRCYWCHGCRRVMLDLQQVLDSIRPTWAGWKAEIGGLWRKVFWSNCVRQWWWQLPQPFIIREQEYLNSHTSNRIDLCRSSIKGNGGASLARIRAAYQGCNVTYVSREMWLLSGLWLGELALCDLGDVTYVTGEITGSGLHCDMLSFVSIRQSSLSPGAGSGSVAYRCLLAGTLFASVRVCSARVAISMGSNLPLKDSGYTHVVLIIRLFKIFQII